jgi:hypothetical protein
MLALSLHQPFASLLLTPAGKPVKTHETRKWKLPVPYVGSEFLIHAAKRPVSDSELSIELNWLCRYLFGDDWITTLPRGGFLGRAQFNGFRRIGEMGGATYEANDVLCGDFTPGRYAWGVVNAVALPALIPYRGQQGFFKAEIG